MPSASYSTFCTKSLLNFIASQLLDNFISNLASIFEENSEINILAAFDTFFINNLPSILMFGLIYMINTNLIEHK